MNNYIVYMHPKKDSFNGSILQQLTTALIKNNQDVKINHLYSTPFHSHLTWKEYLDSLEYEYDADCQYEHEMIKWADRVIFVFPVWWGGFPAIGKGYIDRVLSYGFAYELKGESPIPLMNDKKVSLIFTTGAPENEFHQSGMYEHLVGIMDKSIFQFCGFILDGILHFGDVIQKSDKERQDMLKEVNKFCEDMMN